MKILSVLLLSTWAGLPGVGAPVVENEPGLPELKLTANVLSIQMKNGILWGYDQPWHLYMGLTLENTSVWNIAWCDAVGAEIVMEDSTGSKTAPVLHNFQKDREGKEGVVMVDSENWVPSAGARWVHVKGRIPFAVSWKYDVSDPVTVKLAKGVNVPVVLKNAGMGGAAGTFEEVKASLQVMEYEDDVSIKGMKGKKWLSLRLSTDRPLGFLRFDMQGMDGFPLNSSNVGMESSFRKGDRYFWFKDFYMDEVKEGECRIGVRYAMEPHQVMAVVDHKVDLSCFSSGEVDREEKTKDAKPSVPREREKAVAAAADCRAKFPVRAVLTGLSVHGGEILKWHGAGEKIPAEWRCGINLVSGPSNGFSCKTPWRQNQSLDVTDSTGRVLKPIMFRTGNVGMKNALGDNYTVLDGTSRVFPSPGAEWIRMRGTFQVPMVRMKHGPVYELPFVEGAAREVPLPGMEEAGRNGNGDDVATADASDICKLWLEKVRRNDKGETEFNLGLDWGGHTFEFEGFELVDEKDAPLAAAVSGNRFFSRSWFQSFKIAKAGEMKKLRLRLLYPSDAELVPVPVDVKAGLSGPIPQESGEKKQ